jgi:hypothetical protein
MNEETGTTDAAPVEESTILGDVADTAENKSADAKPADETPAEKSADEGSDDGADKSDGKADDKGEKVGAPEKYEDFTVPEGIEQDPVAMEQFGEVAKDLNLSQDQAQKLVDLYTKTTTDYSNDAWKTWETVQDDWKGQARNDKEIGGTEFDASIGHAKAFIQQFGGSGLKEALDITGAGNNPEIIRAFARAGKALADDSFHTGTQGGPAKSAEDVLYPSQGEG